MSGTSPNKSKGTTVWVKPPTRDLINRKKRKGESADGFLRRILG